MVKLFPSLIASNILRLEDTVHSLDPFVDGYHLDIMDFHFVPNLTWGPDFINALRLVTKKQLFIHLMVEFPEQYLSRFKLFKNDIISFHYESRSAYSPTDLSTLIGDQGYIPSIAINPKTPVEKAFSINPLQHLLIMSVEPGFSGQQFIPSTLEKIAQATFFRKENNLSFTIAVDGGITKENCRAVVAQGAHELAIATALFKDNRPREALKALRTLLKESY